MQQQQAGTLGAMQHLESRTDEQLLSESKHRAAARALLGARAAERYDATAARTHFNQALAGCHPQERPYLRQMMRASLAQAERRPDELRDAMEKLGQAPPSKRQLLLLRFLGLVAPAPGAGVGRRARGIAVIVGIVLLLLLVGFGLAELIALPFGGVGVFTGLLLGLLIVVVVLGVLALLGRRKQNRARVGGGSPAGTPRTGPAASSQDGAGDGKGRLARLRGRGED
jgi:hypothetical protein